MIVVIPNEDVGGDWLKCNEEHYTGSLSMVMVQSRADLKRMEEGTIILIPYSKVWRSGYEGALHEIVSQCTIVFDEGHRISRVNSQQHKGCYALALKAQAVWVLSGTEVSNTPDQYYGMYRMVTQAGAPSPGVTGLTAQEWVSF